MQLAEKYRPGTWDDVVAQDVAIAQLRDLVRRGAGGRAFFLAGLSGTGKTTLARLLARELADPFFIDEVDAQDVTPEFLRRAEAAMHLYAWGAKPGRVWIVNEAHHLRTPIIARLLTMFEPIPEHVAWIFTTTNAGQEQLFDDGVDSDALMSRCTPIQLSRRGLAGPFAERVRRIATAEGLNGKPIEAYVKLARECNNNLRAMIQAVDNGKMR